MKILLAPSYSLHPLFSHTYIFMPIKHLYAPKACTQKHDNWLWEDEVKKREYYEEEEKEKKILCVSVTTKQKCWTVKRRAKKHRKWRIRKKNVCMVFGLVGSSFQAFKNAIDTHRVTQQHTQNRDLTLFSSFSFKLNESLVHGFSFPFCR